MNKQYNIINTDIAKRYEFRNIKVEDTKQAVEIEKVCFPPNEACSEKNMKERIAKAPEYFLVAIDKTTDMLAGFLNGLATDESIFRDEFFTDAELHNDEGRNIMLLGLDVLPEHRGIGLGRELMYEYCRRQSLNNKKSLLLTCLDGKVEMYKKFGFTDNGIANSSWGGEEWHEMSVTL